MNTKSSVYHVADIMKRTEKSQADYDNLRRAISALEEVMTYALASSVNLFLFCSVTDFFVPCLVLVIAVIIIAAAISNVL